MEAARKEALEELDRLGLQTSRLEPSFVEQATAQLFCSLISLGLGSHIIVCIEFCKLPAQLNR
jgi:hypothetical protein